MGPDGPLQELGDDALRAAVDAVAERRARGGRRLPAARLPPPASTSGRSATRSRERAARRARLALARGRRHVPRVRARRDHRGRRRPLPPAALPTCAGSSSARGEAGLPEPAVMQSSGGLASAAHAGAHAALTVLSGPAGGAAGAAWAAARRGRARRAVLRHGRHLVRRLRDPRRLGARGGRARGRRPARSRCRCSTSTRSAPAAARSAGATRAARCAPARAPRAPGPGPACYGHGGTEPTVTDANLLLGLLARGRVARRRHRARPRRRRRRRCRQLGRRRSTSSRSSAPRASAASPTPRWCARCA